MPQPTSTLATQRPDLEVMEEFDLMAEQAGFIAGNVMPVIEVGKQSGTFGKIPLEQLLQNRDTKRAPGTGYSRGEFTFEPASYATVEQGWEEPVDDNEAAMYADFFSADVYATLRAQHAILENYEKRVAAKLFNASTYTATSVTNEWDDSSNATPIDDVESKVQALYGASGLWPNTMVITRTVFRNLRNCSQIIDRIKYQGNVDVRPGMITVAALSAVFDLNIEVAGGSKNSADEGQTAVVAPIWSNEYCWIGRTATSGDIKEPCVGRTFHWAGDGSESGGRVEQYREEKIRSEVIRVRHQVDEVELHTACNGLLANITT